MGSGSRLKDKPVGVLDDRIQSPGGAVIFFTYVRRVPVRMAPATPITRLYGVKPHNTVIFITFNACIRVPPQSHRVESMNDIRIRSALCRGEAKKEVKLFMYLSLLYEDYGEVVV